MVAVEPGGIRTEWGQTARDNTPEVLPDYEPSVGALLKMLDAYVGHEGATPPRSHRS